MESIKKDNSIGSQILRDIKDGVIVIDKEGKIIFSNPATNEILDIHFNIVGKEISEIIPIEKEHNDDFNEIIIEATIDKIIPIIEKLNLSNMMMILLHLI